MQCNRDNNYRCTEQLFFVKVMKIFPGYRKEFPLERRILIRISGYKTEYVSAEVAEAITEEEDSEFR